MSLANLSSLDKAKLAHIGFVTEVSEINVSFVMIITTCLKRNVVRLTDILLHVCTP